MLPLAVVVLISLFVFQSQGTERVAFIFGPVMLLWFVVMAVGGLMALVKNTVVLQAINPLEGVEFAISNGVIGLTIMGLVFLAVTGAEALYADLGHFGRESIASGWKWIVFPSLALNYLGQGALVLTDAQAIENPFFRLYPQWMLLPIIALATMATVIASQAVISGAFSMTRQAVQLGLLPRLEIVHTSKEIRGQIYVPRINWLLMISVVYIVIAFRTSSHLAAAYGASVTATMLITTVMICDYRGIINCRLPRANANAGGITTKPMFKYFQALKSKPSRRNADSHRMVASEPVTDRLGPRSTPISTEAEISLETPASCTA